ncbi:MAG: DUF3530 family protein [Pseudomonadota bacterium]
MLVSSIAVASSPDYDREQRLADEIVDAVLDGDAEWLEVGDREFLSFYTEADEPRGALVILHGRGFHPDWVDTINPLRVGLIDEGWSTLSLQMPVLHKEAKYYDYVPIFPESVGRIEAGIDFLESAGFDNIVLVAHSCGAHMAMAWFREHGDQRIDGFVGLGLGATDYKQPMRKPLPIDRFAVPFLDLFGEDEFPAVIRLAPDRLAAMSKAGNTKSRQVVLKGADHYFTDHGDKLTSAVAHWLDTLK